MNAKQAARVLRQMGATPTELLGPGWGQPEQRLSGHLYRIEYAGTVPDHIREAWLREAIREIEYIRRSSEAVKAMFDMNNNRRQA